MAEPMPSNAIAIIGLSGRFPGADSLEAFWRNVAGGVECLSVPTDAELSAAGVPDELRSHPRYVRKYTALEGDDCFDADFFAVSPRDAHQPRWRLLFLSMLYRELNHGPSAAISIR